VALQPSIVRVYKVAGLVALTAILVGLLGFLTVNIFYFFDKSWTRVVVLDKGHEKVKEATIQLANAKERSDALASEKLDIESELAKIDRTADADEKFVAAVGVQETPKTPDAWLLHREIVKVKLDREEAVSRRIPLNKRLENLKKRIAEHDKFVLNLQSSPYARANEQRIVAVFVPHKNLRENVKVGTKLYGCAWGLVRCSHVGKVNSILDGEVTDKHPHDESTQRGQLVEIEIEPSAVENSVLFAGSKPLWLF
jgi:hypothetical protein